MDLTVLLSDPPEKFVLGHARMLDDNEFFDLLFSFDAPEHKKDQVHAHVAVITERLPCLFDESKYCSRFVAKKGITHVSLRRSPQIAQLSPSLLRDILRWAYCGALPEAPLKLVSIVDLFLFAEDVSDRDLVHGCEQKLVALMNEEPMHNVVATVFPRTREDQRLRQCVLAHVFSRWDVFISDKEGGRKLGIDLMQELTMIKARHNSEQVRSATTWASRPVLNVFKLIFVSRVATDASIVCESGEVIECHRSVLAAASPLLRQTFQTVSSSGKTRTSPRSPRGGVASPRGDAPISNINTSHMVLLEPKPTVSAATAMCLFLYAGVVTFSAADAVYLINHVARRFQITALQSACERSLSAGLSMDSASVAVAVLAITYLTDIAAKPNVRALRKQGLKFVVDNFTKLDLGLLLSVAEPKVRADVLYALQSRLRHLEGLSVPGTTAGGNDDELLLY